MSRSSGRKGQVEPLAALAGVFAVCVALGVYAGAVETSLPTTGERDRAREAVDAASTALERTGVVDPVRLDTVDPVPDGFQVNLTLVANDRRWHVGPPAPAGADRATERVSVRVAPTRVRPGRLVARVWR